MSRPVLYHGRCASKGASGGFDCFPETLIPSPQMAASGREGSFVFATPKILSAISYSINARNEDVEVAHVIFSTMINNGVVLMVFDNYEKLSYHPIGRVYEVSNDGFIPDVDGAGVGTGEWICDSEVSKLNLLREVSIDDAMNFGVQIFVPKSEAEKEDVLKEIYFMQQRIGRIFGEIFARGDIDEKQKGIEITAVCLSEFKGLAMGGLLVHLNQEKCLNPVDFESGELMDMSCILTNSFSGTGAVYPASVEKPFKSKAPVLEC